MSAEAMTSVSDSSRSEARACSLLRSRWRASVRTLRQAGHVPRLGLGFEWLPGRGPCRRRAIGGPSRRLPPMVRRLAEFLESTEQVRLFLASGAQATPCLQTGDLADGSSAAGFQVFPDAV